MKYIERAVITLFCTVAFFAATWAIVIGVADLFEANGWKPMSASDWGTWVGAIGTVFALIGAIWIASGERRQRRTSERDLAVITAGKVFVTISKLQNQMQLLCNVLPVYQEAGDGAFQIHAEEIKQIGRLATDDLLRLACLPDRIAARLASADAVLDHIVQGLQRAAELQPGSPNRAAYIDGLITHATFANKSFAMAAKECKRAIETSDSQII